MYEAILYEKLEGGRVRCQVCAHHCVISEGSSGVCRARENIAGTLYTRVYGQVISQHNDPIEKKPLYHFLPGTTSYSIAAPGCNFRCRWCQNWEISQMLQSPHQSYSLEQPPHAIVSAALAAGSSSIAYTYTEPTIFIEYALDVARLAQENGLANVFVTNGYLTAGALEVLHPYLDAANVDLKSFRKLTYRRFIEARLSAVLDGLRMMKNLGIWVEVTTLVIPGINDDPQELKDIASFIAGDLGVDTPWHISRFFPDYKMFDRPPTPHETMEQARQIGLQAGLRYVYLGNIGNVADTLCSQCGQVLVRRHGYRVAVGRLESGACRDCGAPVAGVWKPGRWRQTV